VRERTTEREREEREREREREGERERLSMVEVSRRATPQKQWVKKCSPFEFLRGSSEAVGSKHETPIPT
jgi:hypothetical protein